MKLSLAIRYPNTKPRYFTLEELRKRGMAIECKGHEDSFGRTTICTINIFGIREFHFLYERKIQ